jgi:hypothetical protein
MVLPEVVRAAELLARAWAGDPPADAGGRERCRQLVGILRQHDAALVADAERAGAAVDVERLHRALADAARTSPAMRTLLGQLVQTRPAHSRGAGAQISINGNGNQVIAGDALRMMSELGHGVFRTTPPCVLFLAANPLDSEPLRLGYEERRIREVLERSEVRHTFETRQAVRPEDLTGALSRLRPRIVHFSGHGEASGKLRLETDAGETHEVTPQALARVFGALAGEVECVVLNACFSSEQAEAISKYVRYVVGMRHEVGDEAAVAFATGFYQAVGSGRPIPQAVEVGRGLFGMMNLPERLLPVILLEGAVAA